METNLAALNTNLTAIVSQGVDSVQQINWNTIIVAFIGFLGVALSAVMTLFMAKIKANTQKTVDNTQKTVENTEETKQAAKATAGTVEQVHTAVNSERTAMLAKVEALHDKILQVSKEKATLEDAVRSDSVARVVKESTVAAAVAATAAATAPPVPAVVKIVAPAAEGGGALSIEELDIWIKQLQDERAKRPKK